MKTTVDLTPILALLAPYVLAILSGVVLAVLGYVGRHVPKLAKTTALLQAALAAQADNKILEAYIQHGLVAGVEKATGSSAASVDVRSVAVAHATQFVLEQMPQRLERLGVSPEQLEQRVAVLAAGQPAVQAATA